MDLKELKGEVEQLHNMSQCIDRFKASWIAPLRKNSNLQFSFIAQLPTLVQDQLQNQLLPFHNSLEQLRSFQVVNEKLSHIARNLIELKLSTLRGEKQKSNQIVHHLLHDDFIQVRATLAQVKALNVQLQALSTQYQHINGSLEPHLRLEDQLAFSSLPHQRYWQELQRGALRQQDVATKLGNHFMKLVKS